jgi:3-oxoacyl-[acyl-carrier-protein] synthase-3
LRTIFGDGAAATLIEAAGEPSLGGFVFGTDGRGADTLMVGSGGARPAADALKPRKRKRWPSALTMDGPEIAKFALEVLPPMVERVLQSAKWTRDDVELYLMHQATFFLLEHLRVRLNLSEAQMPLALKEYGNTVSCTLPLLMHDLRVEGRLRPGVRTMMIGFGVGLSWAGCTWTETWQPTQAAGAASAASADRKNLLDAQPGANGDVLPEGVFKRQHAEDKAKAADGT